MKIPNPRPLAESIAYAVFLRPRRFGKSLLASILEAYYDVRYADRYAWSSFSP